VIPSTSMTGEGKQEYNQLANKHKFRVLRHDLAIVWAASLASLRANSILTWLLARGYHLHLLIICLNLQGGQDWTLVIQNTSDSGPLTIVHHFSLLLQAMVRYTTKNNLDVVGSRIVFGALGDTYC